MDQGAGSIASIRQLNIPSKSWVTLAILTFVNLTSYSDRFILSVVVPGIKDEFAVNNDLVGLLHTAFFILYVFAAPVYGYLGDRFSRKLLIAFSVFEWNITNLSSSFATTYWPFFVLRTFFGIGHAGHTTTSPSIIGDLFIGSMRSKALSIFYLAIPVGMSFGYMVGRHLEAWLGSWRWTLRMPTVLGVVNLFLIVLFVKEPVRGELEGKTFSATLLLEDISYLSKNASFIFSTLAFSCVAFTAQSASWWGPHLIDLGVTIISKDIDLSLIATLFGVIALTSGILGLIFGYFLSKTLKKRYPFADPLICGVGLFICVSTVIGGSFFATSSTTVWFVCLFLGLVFLNMNWAIIIDMLLSVVLPNKRSFAISMQLLAAHTLGSLPSPYLVGLLSDYLYTKGMSRDEDWNQFKSLQFAFFAACGIGFLGGILYFICACYILEDMKKMKNALTKYGDTDY